MEWFSGDISECIKEVKTKKALFLVLSKDSTSALSSEILEALGSQDVARLCQGMVCLQLDAGTTPYIQFSSIYEVPSVPCIHLIPPTGEILSVKTTDFSAENLAQWLGENAEKFDLYSDASPEVKEADKISHASINLPQTSPSANVDSPDESPISITTEATTTDSVRLFPPTVRPCEIEAVAEPQNEISTHGIEEMSTTDSVQLPPTSVFTSDVEPQLEISTPIIQEAKTTDIVHLPPAASVSASEPVAYMNQQDELSNPALQEPDNTDSTHLPSTSVATPEKITDMESHVPVVSESPEGSAASVADRVQYAHRKLEEKKNAKAVANFQETHEQELKRRNLGREMSDFKSRQREQQIRERMEEQRRDKAEAHKARQRVLAQIQEDRHDRFGGGDAAVSPPKRATTVAPTASSSRDDALPNISTANPSEVRLQLRLPDGAHMIGIFSPEARLGSDVRDFIASRVFPSSPPSADGGAPPLSDPVRASFAASLGGGYTFRQTRLVSPRRFTTEEETVKTLRELELWPSAVLMLHSDGGSGGSTAGGNGASTLVEYSQDIASKLFSVVGGGVRSAASLIVYLGEAAISLGQSIWAALPFGSGGGRTVGRSGSPRPRQEDHDAPNEPKARPPTDPSDTAAYRRQGKITRLSHMPDDSDEQARWNGNSTTQL